MSIPGFIAPILNQSGKSFVKSGWGEDRSYRGGIHNGLDFPAIVGTPVRAVADGTVITASNIPNDAAGNMLVIHHGGGWHSRYLHLDRFAVPKGAAVSKGQLVGYSGASGIKQSEAHLHFDIRVLGNAQNDWIQKFGAIPTNSEKVSTGLGVPAEALVPVDVLAPKVLARMAQLGITRATPSNMKWLIAGGVAVVAGLIFARYV